MLIAKDIWFSFQRPVLEAVSFELTEGQLVGLIGPNGSGKTTLLRIMRNRLHQDGGTVLLKGKPIESYSRQEQARLIGYVLQDHHVGFPLSVIEYVLQGRYAFSGGFAFESRGDIEAAERAMELTNTLGFRDQKVDELSGGERQRVVLARALAADPEVLLLDEPTANMDLAYQVEMLSLIKRLTIEKGLLSVFVTHELNLAAEFAGRLLLLRRGRILADGRPRDVINEENMQALFDCGFQVDMNPLSGAPRVSIIVKLNGRSER
jgi:iron complex transport system ATP-binding protein